MFAVLAGPCGRDHFFELETIVIEILSPADDPSNFEFLIVICTSFEVLRQL